jgi:hypothetical protein
VVEDAATFRTKEQVLRDLSAALRFSPASLEANRKGRLSSEQIARLLPLFVRPFILMVVFAVAPLAIWTWIKAERDGLPMGAAFPALINELLHVKDLFEAHGKMGGGIMIGSIVISLLIAVLMAFKVPVLLYLDLLDRKVEPREGRVVAREETINRPNGRDPIEKYFFSLRYLSMPVNLAAFRALEAGSLYVVYLLPRSEVMAAIEPKIEAPKAAEPVPEPVPETVPEEAPAVAEIAPEQPSQA